MLVQASTLSLLPPSLSSSSTKPLSLLFDPASQSLAVTLTDSSVLLFSSFSAASSPSPPLSIPPVSTSACFLILNSNPNPSSGRPLFVSASPSPSSSATLIRAWIRRSRLDLFAPIALTFKKKVRRLSGLAIDLRHGFGVRVAGSVNVLVVHSAAESEIWVLGVRMVGGDGEERVELEKCAVIECTMPIYEIRVSMGVLVLGETGGVRVFPLRPMVKGGQGLRKKGKDLNGVGAGEQRTRCKLRTLKLRQDSDGAHTVHVTSVADMELPVRETDENENMEKEMQISAIQVIFTSEKVQDIVPLSANAILILGQGSIFSYSIA